MNSGKKLGKWMLIGMLVTAVIAVILPTFKLQNVANWMVTFSDLFAWVGLQSIFEKKMNWALALVIAAFVSAIWSLALYFGIGFLYHL